MGPCLHKAEKFPSPVESEEDLPQIIENLTRTLKIQLKRVPLLYFKIGTTALDQFQLVSIGNPRITFQKVQNIQMALMGLCSMLPRSTG